MAASANLIGIYVRVTLKYPASSTVQGTVAEIAPETATLVLREGKHTSIIAIQTSANMHSSSLPRQRTPAALLDRRGFSDRRHQYRPQAAR